MIFEEESTLVTAARGMGSLRDERRGRGGGNEGCFGRVVEFDGLHFSIQLETCSHDSA